MTGLPRSTPTRNKPRARRLTAKWHEIEARAEAATRIVRRFMADRGGGRM